MTRGMREVGALVAVIALAASAPRVWAQATPLERVGDPLLDRLVGDWRMTGQVRGNPVSYRLSVSPVLASRFLELHMTDTGVPPRYEARVFIGEDTVPGRLIVHWLDSFGAAYSVPPGYGGITGDTVRFEVAYPGGPFRDTLVFRRAEGVWEVLIEAGVGPGEWRTFARYTVRPLGPRFR